MRTVAPLKNAKVALVDLEKIQAQIERGNAAEKHYRAAAADARAAVAEQKRLAGENAAEAQRIAAAAAVLIDRHRAVETAERALEASRAGFEDEMSVRQTALDAATAENAANLAQAHAAHEDRDRALIVRTAELARWATQLEAEQAAMTQAYAALAEDQADLDVRVKRLDAALAEVRR